MSGSEPSEDDRSRRSTVLLVVGLVLLVGGLVGASGDSGPSDRIDVYDGIEAGAQFESLSGNATDRLRPAFENGTDPGLINRSDYDATFPTLPDDAELVDRGYVVAYEDQLYLLELVAAGNDTYRLSVTDYTATVRIEYARLSPDDRAVVDRAASADGPIDVSTAPRFEQAPGVEDADLGGESRLYYLSWDGGYYTVAVYEPVEYVEAPSSGQILGALAAVLGAVVAIVGLALRLRAD